jgi:hypothetical protein
MDSQLVAVGRHLCQERHTPGCYSCFPITSPLSKMLDTFICSDVKVVPITMKVVSESMVLFPSNAAVTPKTMEAVIESMVVSVPSDAAPTTITTEVVSE